MLDISEVPDTWKHEQITPHYKKGSVLDKTNFRPVSVLPAFGKVFESIIHMQMTKHFEPIFPNFMFVGMSQISWVSHSAPGLD